MLELLVNYYELVAKITYGAEFLISAEELEPTTVNRYNILLNNISVLHSKIKKMKAEKGLPMFDFNNIKKGNIHIENGFLVGNIKNGREEAYSLVADLKREAVSEKNLKEYELGLYALNLSSKVKESYIAPRSELNNDVTKVSNDNDTKVLTTTNVEKPKEDERDRKQSEKKQKMQKQNLYTAQFSMFSSLS